MTGIQIFDKLTELSLNVDDFRSENQGREGMGSKGWGQSESISRDQGDQGDQGGIKGAE